MKLPWIIIAVLGGMVAYNLYTPVPDGIEEKLKFRAYVAVPRVFRMLGSLMGLFNGKHPLQNVEELSRYLISQPPSTVEGSNIRSEVVTFDGIRVLLYKPIERKNKSPVAGLMFFHGGGYMIGSPELYDELTRKIAEELNIVVASVDYRLTTEQKFPAAHEDAMTALRYFFSHAAELGVDPTRIGVAGDSSGGHLTAAVAQEAADDSTLPRLKLQVLLYPWLQLFDLQTPSYQQYRHDFGPNGGVITRDLTRAFRTHFLLGREDYDLAEVMLANNHTSLAFKKANPHMYDHKLVPKALKEHVSYKGPVMDRGINEVWDKYKDLFLDPRFTPLWREDLSKLPPAYIISCQYDGLRDDAVIYSKRLEQAGVQVKFTNYYNGWHGMLNAQSFSVGQRSLKYLITHLKETL